MGTVEAAAAGALGAVVALPLGLHGLAYIRAATAKRRARHACPFDDDDHDTLPVCRAIQLIAAESALWLYAIATAVWPRIEPGSLSPRTLPIVLLVPAWMPRATVRILVARLRNDGFSVVCARLALGPRSPARRVHSLDRVLRQVWDRFEVPAVDVLAVSGAAADVATHLAAGGSGVPTVRRLITLGAAGSMGPRVPASTETIALYSTDDPFLGPIERARRPESLNVAVRGLGRLGLLHAPHVYPLVREHLLAPTRRAPPSWTNARS